MKVAVVILNYNGKDFLKKFLPTVIKYSEKSDVIVADNGSTDDSVSFLKENFPEIRIIINPINGGFASGYNQALSHVEAEYYVLLNSDIEVTPNWIEPCISLLENDSQIAAVQPKILSFANKKSFEHAGAAGGFLDKNYFPFCRGRIFDIVETDQGQYNNTSEVFWATGAALFIRAELYHQMGGLDDDFFAHMEEIDLCWRLKKSGHKIYYCAESKVYHVGGGTLDYLSPRKIYLNFRNSLYMIAKNHEGFLLTKLIHRLILDGMAAILFLIRGKFPYFLAVFRAHMHFYKHWPTLKKKRKEIKQNSLKMNQVGIYNESIVVKKFIKKITRFSQLNAKDFKTN